MRWCYFESDVVALLLLQDDYDHLNDTLLFHSQNAFVHMPSSQDKSTAKEEEWFSDQLSAYGALSKGEC